MSDKYVIAADVAAKQLAAMEDEFGSLADKSARDVLTDAIRRGTVDFNADAAIVTYRLQRPVELENGKIFDSIALEEPTIEQLQRIDRGQMLKVDANRQVEIDASVGHQQILKLMTVVGGVALGVAQRIKRRDVAVLQALSGFFG